MGRYMSVKALCFGHTVGSIRESDSEYTGEASAISRKYVTQKTAIHFRAPLQALR